MLYEAIPIGGNVHSSIFKLVRIFIWEVGVDLFGR